MSYRIAWFLGVLLMFAGCDGAGDGDPPDAGPRDAGPAADAAPRSPRILSFGTNVTAITENEAVIFTAVVTDPDGIDDVIGGTLTAPSGATYGAFATTDQEGAYSLELGWSAIDQVESLDFYSNTSRTFLATFFDAAGNTVTAEATITLYCDPQDHFGACEGACVDYSLDDRCGACDVACDASDNHTCELGGSVWACKDQCGNGTIDLVESCDDGNTSAADGCAADCRTIEAGYKCETPGQSCSLACPDGVLDRDQGESCDDTNAVAEDGCDATCQAEVLGVAEERVIEPMAVLGWGVYQGELDSEADVDAFTFDAEAGVSYFVELFGADLRASCQPEGLVIRVDCPANDFFAARDCYFQDTVLFSPTQADTCSVAVLLTNGANVELPVGYFVRARPQ